jgi:hypothetical protein
MKKPEPVPVDWKFSIKAIALHNGKRYTERESVLFLCKDLAVPAMLRFYRNECLNIGCRKNQLRAIDLLIKRVVDWQARHPELLKVADIKGREALTAPVRQTHET